MRVGWQHDAALEMQRRVQNRRRLVRYGVARTVVVIVVRGVTVVVVL